MKAAYRIVEERRAFELTVEDPAVGFSKLRDSVDMERFMRPDTFRRIMTIVSGKKRSRAQFVAECDPTIACRYDSHFYDWIDECNPLSKSAIASVRRLIKTTAAQVRNERISRVVSSPRVATRITLTVDARWRRSFAVTNRSYWPGWIERTATSRMTTVASPTRTVIDASV